MCNKCHPGGHYDATLEQLNHNLALKVLQNGPYILFILWWNTLKMSIYCLKLSLKRRI